MATLSAIRTQFRTLTNETDPNNTHFTSTEIDEYLNQAQTFIATFLEYPRTFVSAQVTQGTADYTLPSDHISIIAAYFGDVSQANGVRPIRVINEETLKNLYPGWLSTNTSTQGTPRFILVKDRSTITLVPTPDAVSSVAGQKYHLNYVKLPDTLTADGDIPEIPLPYHDLLQFYAAHLAYLRLQVQDMADKMVAMFEMKVKTLQSQVNKESKEALGWSWTETDDVSGENDGGIRFT